jgi:hypothetical protein
MLGAFQGSSYQEKEAKDPSVGQNLEEVSNLQDVSSDPHTWFSLLIHHTCEGPTAPPRSSDAQFQRQR